MQKRAKTLVLSGALLLCGSVQLQAAQIVNYPMTSGTEKSPTGVDPAIVASNLDDSVGSFDVSTTSGVAFLRGDASELTLAAAIAAPDYLQFTITPVAGQTLDLQSIVFDHEASNDTTTPFSSNLSIFASTNAFAVTPVAGDELGTSTEAISASIGGGTQLIANDVSFSLSAAQFQGLTSSTTVTFRVYAFDDATSTNQINRIDDIRVNGTLVPEPASLSLLALAALGLGRRRRQP